MSQMLKSSGAMAAATMFSRILGMAREVVYSRFMGATPVASAFILAFQIPNLFRRLLGEGALTASFIPIFKEKERTSTPEDMWRAANAVISGLVVTATIITLVVILGITVALEVGDFLDKTVLMLRLLRVMFPYMILVCLTAVFIGMLNAKGHFFIPATGSVVLNSVLILSVYFLAPHFGETRKEQIFGLAYGVLLAGAGMAVFQLPSLRAEGFHYHWVSPWRDETVHRVVRQMIPGAIGVAAFQINVLMTQSVAYWVDPAIVAWFNYSVRLMELPQGVFGISLATYLLPTLSGLAADKKHDQFRHTLNNGIDHLVFLNLLASILLCVLAVPILRLLFQGGEFTARDTTESALALMTLAPGLIAFSLVNILARAFYALGDTTTPMRISIFCLVLNLVFGLSLVWKFRQGGLGAANTLSAIFNVGLLFYALRRKLGHLGIGELRKMLVPVFASGIVAGVVAALSSQQWEQHFGHRGLIMRMGAVFVPMGAASLAYFGVALAFRVGPALEMGQLALGRKAVAR